MQKLLGILLLFSVLLGCKKTEPASAETTGEELAFNYQKLPQKTVINEKATAIVETWEEFKALNPSMDVLYKATNNEDLSLAIDDLIEKEKANFSICRMCKVLRVSESGYYAWLSRPASQRQRDDMVYLAHVRAEHARNYRAYYQ